MTRDRDAELAQQEAMFDQANALLDRILDNLPPREQGDELVFPLAGPFGVDWRASQEPQEAPPAAWEPTVLELGHDVAEAMCLDPLWADDPADFA